MKKVNIVITPDFLLKQTDRPGKNDQIIISHDQILERLPETVRTEPVITAARNLCLQTITALVRIEFPMQGFGKIIFKTDISKDQKKILKAKLIEFLCKPVGDLKIQVRTFNALKAAGVNYVYDFALLKSSPSLDELKKFRNFGNRAFVEITTILEENGVTKEVLGSLGSKLLPLEKILLETNIGTVASFYEMSEVKQLEKICGDVLIKKLNAFLGYSSVAFSSFENSIDKNDVEKKRHVQNLLYEIKKAAELYLHTELQKIIEAMDL